MKTILFVVFALIIFSGCTKTNEDNNPEVKTSRLIIQKLNYPIIACHISISSLKDTESISGIYNVVMPIENPHIDTLTFNESTNKKLSWIIIWQNDTVKVNSTGLTKYQLSLYSDKIIVK